MRNWHACYVNNYDLSMLFGKYSKRVVELGEFWHYTM